jgi:post-segregation antitoxin (ccd killing protein)
MKQRRHTTNPVKRRTTLSLPADSLIQAERIARARRVNLSTVVSEALSDGLRMHRTAEQSEAILNAYKQAFTGFSDEEMLVLDGVMLERAASRK